LLPNYCLPLLPFTHTLTQPVALRRVLKLYDLIAYGVGSTVGAGRFCFVVLSAIVRALSLFSSRPAYRCLLYHRRRSGLVWSVCGHLLPHLLPRLRLYGKDLCILDCCLIDSPQLGSGVCGVCCAHSTGWFSVHVCLHELWRAVGMDCRMGFNVRFVAEIV
jgi:hypothetical protein